MTHPSNPVTPDPSAPTVSVKALDNTAPNSSLIPQKLDFRFDSSVRWLVIFGLAWTNTYFLISHIIEPLAEQRMLFAQQVLSGQMEPPYQYRILKHVLAMWLGQGVAVVSASATIQHIVSYGVVSFATFVGIFWSLWRHLERYLSPTQALIGVLLVQVSLPLAVTGFVMEGDFITLLVYLLVLEVAHRDKPSLLLPLLLVGAFNREQVVYSLVFYAVIVWSQQGALRRDQLLGVLGGTLAWALVFEGLRMYYGFKPTRYTPALHIAHNTSWLHLWRDILPLWFAELGALLFLMRRGWSRASLGLKRCCLALMPYFILYFLNGNLWELGKFLPAWLFIVPVAVQGLFAGKGTPDKSAGTDGADSAPGEAAPSTV